MRYFAHLNLPFEVDLRDQTIREHDLTKLGHFNQDPSTLPTLLVEWLESLGITITHAEVFYTPPFTRLPTHTDGRRINSIVKLNWQFGAQGSVMNWFRLKDPTAEVQAKKTIIGTTYLRPNDEQCVMTASTRIRAPTLVNVGQLHSVINSTAEQRWVMSVVLAHNNFPLEMPLALEIFRPFLAP